MRPDDEDDDMTPDPDNITRIPNPEDPRQDDDEAEGR